MFGVYFDPPRLRTVGGIFLESFSLISVVLVFSAKEYSLKLALTFGDC